MTHLELDDVITFHRHYLNSEPGSFWSEVLKFYLEDKGVFTFNLGRDPGMYYKGFVKIGCSGMYLNWWLMEYEDMGKAYNYSEVDLFWYGWMLHALAGKEFNRG